MIKCYYKTSTTYHNGVEIGRYRNRIIVNAEDPQPELVKLTWGNLDDFYYHHGLECHFNIWYFKKGRVVSFFSNKFRGDFADVKEWKSPDLNITISYEYSEYTPSLDEVFHWSDSASAIQWLKEHGLDGIIKD